MSAHHQTPEIFPMAGTSHGSALTPWLRQNLGLRVASAGMISLQDWLHRSHPGPDGYPVAVGVRLPFNLMPACQRLHSPGAQKAIRSYLDHLLTELRDLGDAWPELKGRVTHLWWFDDAAYWLSEAQMTELMYWLCKRLDVPNHRFQYACIVQQRPLNQPSRWPLLAGLGFQHVWALSPDMSEQDRQAQAAAGLVRHDVAGTRQTEPDFPEFPEEGLMIGLGAGARSRVAGQDYSNPTTLDQYLQLMG